MTHFHLNHLGKAQGAVGNNGCSFIVPSFQRRHDSNFTILGVGSCLILCAFNIQILIGMNKHEYKRVLMPRYVQIFISVFEKAHEGQIAGGKIHDTNHKQ